MCKALGMFSVQACILSFVCMQSAVCSRCQTCSSRNFISGPWSCPLVNGINGMTQVHISCDRDHTCQCFLFSWLNMRVHLSNKSTQLVPDILNDCCGIVDQTGSLLFGKSTEMKKNHMSLVREMICTNHVWNNDHGVCWWIWWSPFDTVL